MSCKRIFEHTNYLEFLKSEFEIKKAADPQWSVSRWAREMELMNVVGLHMMMKGQRRPGTKSVPHFSRFFNFTEQEEVYFKKLIKKDLFEKDMETKSHIESELKILASEDKGKQLDNAQFSFIADWYHFAIQQMITKGPLKNDVRGIKSLMMYDVSEVQIEKALQNLLNLNIIRLEDGYFHCVEQSVRTTKDVPSEALKLHHEQMIGNAKLAIRSVPITERQIQGRTLVIKQQDIQKAADLISSFSSKLGVDLDSQDGDRVYQLNVQFFPLTESLNEI